MIGSNKALDVAGLDTINIDLIYSGLEKLPAEGEEVFSKDFKVAFGGGGVATLLQLARLGLDVTAATFIGRDMFSAFAEDFLKNQSVNVINLYKKGFALNVSSAMLTPSDRTFVSYGTAATISEQEEKLLFDSFRSAKAVLMKTGNIGLYRKLKNSGCKLILDVGWSDGLSISGISEYLCLADYFTPNKKEALKLTGKDNVKEAAEVLSGFFRDVLIKLDKDGCYVLSDGTAFTVPPVSGVKAVDSTGAGDAFLAGFTYGIVRGESFIKSVKYGNVTGARCVEEYGAVTAVTSYDDLQSAFDKAYN